jgi:hypothetical protein
MERTPPEIYYAGISLVVFNQFLSQKLISEFPETQLITEGVTSNRKKKKDSTLHKLLLHDFAQSNTKMSLRNDGEHLHGVTTQTLFTATKTGAHVKSTIIKKSIGISTGKFDSFHFHLLF